MSGRGRGRGQRVTKPPPDFTNCKPSPIRDKTRARGSKPKVEEEATEQNFMTAQERVEKLFDREIQERKALILPLSEIFYKGMNKASLAVCSSTEGNAPGSTPPLTCDEDSGESSSPRFHGDFVPKSKPPVEIITRDEVKQNLANMYGVSPNGFLERRKQNVLKTFKKPKAKTGTFEDETRSSIELLPAEIRQYNHAKEEYEKATKKLEEKMSDMEIEFKHQVLTLKSDMVEWWHAAVESFETDWDNRVQTVFQTTRTNTEAQDKLKTLNLPKKQ